MIPTTPLRRRFPRSGTIVVLWRSFLFSLLITLSFLVGCGSNPSGNHEGEEIFPLAVGNRWEGRLTTYNLSTGDSGVEGTPVIYEVSGDTTIDGIWWFIYNDGRHFRSSSEGVYDFLNLLHYKFPGVTHEYYGFDTVIVSADPPDTETTVFANQIMAIDTMITVPAGTFTCYLYREAILAPSDILFPSEQREFFAPGVGPVRIDRYNSDQVDTGQPFERWELTSYHLN